MMKQRHNDLLARMRRAYAYPCSASSAYDIHWLTSSDDQLEGALNNDTLLVSRFLEGVFNRLGPVLATKVTQAEGSGGSAADPLSAFLPPSGPDAQINGLTPFIHHS